MRKKIVSGENTMINISTFKIEVNCSVEMKNNNDISVSAFLLNSEGKVSKNDDFIFYKNPRSKSKCVGLNSDNPEDQFFTLDLSKIPTDIKKISFVITLPLEFSFINQLSISIENILLFSPETNGMKEKSLVLGELYIHNNQWKFRALGMGFKAGLSPLATSYGVEIDDKSTEQQDFSKKVVVETKYIEAVETKYISVDILLETTKNELNYIVACIMQVNSKSASDFTSRVGKAFGAKIAGAATATGFLGLVSTFGTAGTGTAIASLSGAAATNATFAWVGGIVGGGMAAGTFLTGGLALVVGVGVYKLFGSKAREYETLDGLDKKIVDTCIILIKAINEQKDKIEKPTLTELNLINKHSIAPLFKLMSKNKDDICSRLDIKNSWAFSSDALPSYKRNVFDVFSYPNNITGVSK